MILLGLDIGKRRTGVALADDAAGFVIALDTVHHKTEKELIDRISSIAKTRQADELIIGLPRLPQGEEGDQAVFVRDVARQLEEVIKLPITFIDERYSTTEKQGGDNDARAACQILEVVVDQRKSHY